MLVHAVGLGFALAGLLLLIPAAATLPDFQNASVWIYGTGLIALFTTSAAYNVWPVSATKLLLRRCDQSAIYLFIAASYTPLIALSDHTPHSEPVLATTWVVALFGTILKLWFPGRFERLSILLCLALGWSGMLAYDEVFGRLSPLTLGLVIAAGALYSVGILFHLWDHLRFQNAIWHGFVVAAAGLQFLAVFSATSTAALAMGSSLGL
jgi:hemolysin III